MSNFAIAGLQLSLAPTDNLDLVIKKTRKTLALGSDGGGQ